MKIVLEEVKKIIVQDEKFSNMTEIEKINTICDLINRVKTKNSLLSLLEKIPHVFDTYHYSDELPEIYYDNCDILNLLGIDFELCETDLGDKFTIISRFEVVGKNEQDRILNEFVKKKVR